MTIAELLMLKLLPKFSVILLIHSAISGSEVLKTQGLVLVLGTVVGTVVGAVITPALPVPAKTFTGAVAADETAKPKAKIIDMILLFTFCFIFFPPQK